MVFRGLWMVIDIWEPALIRVLLACQGVFFSFFLFLFSSSFFQCFFFLEGGGGIFYFIFYRWLFCYSLAFLIALFVKYYLLRQWFDSTTLLRASNRLSPSAEPPES